MNILFITRESPWPPHAGDLLFTKELIDSLSEHDEVKLTVYCGNLGADAVSASSNFSQANIFFGKKKTYSSIRSIFSRYPRAVVGAIDNVDIKNIKRMLVSNDFDFVFMNETSVGNVAISIGKKRREEYVGRAKEKYVYISHNVDYVLRPKAAKEEDRFFKRLVMVFDAWKYSKTERKVIEYSDVVTAISDEDKVVYERDYPESEVFKLSPGYGGQKVFERKIDITTPRIVAIVGSFLWHVKQKNLMEILEAFRDSNEAGVIVRVAGKMTNEFRLSCLERYPFIEIIPNFENVNLVLKDVRMALVLERVGGGFKLKTLDYIFNRIPVVAYKESINGSGLVDGESCFVVDNVEEACSVVNEYIDNLDELNLMHDNAFNRTLDKFSWETRVNELVSFLKESVV